MTKNYTEFHDGTFEGIWTSNGYVSLFLSTAPSLAKSGGGHFVISAAEPRALFLSDMLLGNIILDVVENGPEGLVLDDVATAYGLNMDDPAEAAQAQKRLDEARNSGTYALVIAPSYGATCVVLAKHFDMLPENEWLRLHKAVLPAGKQGTGAPG